jgi:hypothetical protein
MADFYKQGGSYFTTSGQKVANPTELQNLAKAGGKEIAMPSVPTGATKISDPNYLKTAGLTEKDIFRQGKDIYRLPSINTTLDAEQVSPDVPEPEAVNDVSSYTAGIDTTIKGLEENIKKINEPLPQEQEISEIRKRQGELSEQKAKVQETALPKAEEFGYTQYTKELQSILPQIASLKAQYDNAEIAQEGRIGSASSIYGRQALIQRQRAVELAGLGAIAQAYQGNIQLATQTVKDMIDMELAPIQTRIDDQKWQIEQVYEQLTSAEQKKADSLNLVLAERQRLLDEEKDMKNNIAKTALEAAKNGADQATIEKIMNAKTYGEAIINSGQYLKTSTGTNWDTFVDESTGETKLVNKNTGEVKNIGNYNLGESDGEMFGLPTFNTRESNPGMNRSDRNNNPGNIKVSDYTKEFEGVVGVESSPAKDGGNFLIFESPEAGIDAIGRLLLEGNSYQGVNAETAIKKYNGNGSYGASDVGLNPNENFQSQIKDPTKLKAVANAIAKAEGFTGASVTPPDEVSGLVELVRTGQLTPKEALGQVSEKNRTILTEQLSKIEIEKVISSYTEEMKNRTLESVDELLTQVNPYTVGFGVLAKGIPTSQARSFAAQLDTLKANIAFGELTAMREASKTGGALGQVSDREGKLLANALGALDQGQSPEQFKAQLEKIKNSINKWKQEVNQYSSQSNISTVDLTDLNFKFE